MDADPAVSAWHESMGLSTSAILRRTQDELAEAREQLAVAEAERDVARKLGKTLSDQHHGVLRELAEARAEAKGFRAQAELYLRQRDTALRDKAEIRHALKVTQVQYAAVVDFAAAFKPGAIVVARQDVGECVQCGRPIVRSQGAEVAPGTTDQFQHAYCPDAEEGS